MERLEGAVRALVNAHFRPNGLATLVIAFKRVYCSSRDLIGCQNSRASVKSSRMFKTNWNSLQLAAIYFAKLNQSTTLNLQVLWLL